MPAVIQRGVGRAGPTQFSCLYQLRLPWCFLLSSVPCLWDPVGPGAALRGSHLRPSRVILVLGSHQTVHILSVREAFPDVQSPFPGTLISLSLCCTVQLLVFSLITLSPQLDCNFPKGRDDLQLILPTESSAYDRNSKVIVN